MSHTAPAQLGEVYRQAKATIWAVGKAAAKRRRRGLSARASLRAAAARRSCAVDGGAALGMADAGAGFAAEPGSDKAGAQVE